MSLTTDLRAAFEAVGADVSLLQQLLNGKASDLSALTTTDKTSLVASLNEIHALIADATEIDDSATEASSTWSSSRISTAITDAVNGLLNGAPAALDTLKELATALNNNPTIISTILNAQANRIAVDISQSFSAAQQAQACANIGVGDPATNFVAAYTNARDA